MKYKKGFTIVELVTYVGVLTILLVAFIQFVLATIRNDRLFNHRVRVAEEVDFVLRTITDTLRTAKNINVAGSFPSQSVFGINGADCLIKGGTDAVHSRIAFTRNGLNSFECLKAAYGVSPGTDKNGIIFKTASGETLRLTSPRVRVDAFRADCIGPNPCGADPKSVRITLQLFDIDSGESLTATTSVTPRGFD